MAEIPQNQFAVGKGTAQVLGTSNPNAVLEAIERSKASKAQKPIEYEEWNPDKDPSDYYAPLGAEAVNKVRDYSVQFFSKNPQATKFDLEKDPTYRGLTNGYYTMTGSSHKVKNVLESSDEWDKTDVNEDFLARRKKDFMNPDPTKANIEKFETTPFHPNYYDADKGLTTWAKNYSDQLKDEKITEKNGVINIDGISARFGYTNDKGEPVAEITKDLLETALESNPNVDMAIRWQIATERAKNPEDEEEIQAIYDKIKHDSSVTGKVYDKARDIFEQLQKVATKNSQRNVKESSSGSGIDFNNFEIVTTNGEKLKNSIDDVKGNVLGNKGVSVELPNLIKDMWFEKQEMKASVTKIETNADGDLEVLAINKDGVEVRIPLDHSTKTQLINSFTKNSSDKQGMTKLIERLEKANTETTTPVKLDREKFDNTIGKIFSQTDNIKWNNSSNEDLNEKITSDLKEQGIEAELKFESGIAGGNYVRINDGERISLDTKEGQKIIADIFFNEHKDSFREYLLD
jgi:hypothetical protein